MQQAPGAALAYAFLHNLLESLRGQIGLMRQSMKVVTRTKEGSGWRWTGCPAQMVASGCHQAAPSYLGRVNVSKSMGGRN